MMNKIYISADIEGIWGNVNSAYTMPGVPEYEQYRRRMIDEVNIVAQTLFKYGIQEILVNDGHGNMDNLLPEDLDPRVRLVCSQGAFKENGMMEGISAEFDGACFIGYHCRSKYARHHGAYDVGHHDPQCLTEWGGNRRERAQCASGMASWRAGHSGQRRFAAQRYSRALRAWPIPLCADQRSHQFCSGHQLFA